MNTRQYPRLYKTMADSHLKSYRQMVFLSGPRQVGKTTIGESIGDLYLSWDDSDARRIIQEGQRAVFDKYDLGMAAERDKTVVFDEIHKSLPSHV